MEKGIRDWDGKPISEPGIYRGIPMDDYHGQLTEGPSISSSGIRTIGQKSPLHYYADSYLNPNRSDEGEKDHFSFGRAAHSMSMGDEHFAESFVLSPHKDFRTKEAKAWRDEQTKTIIRQDWLPQIRAMSAMLAEEPAVMAGALQGEIEHSIVWKDEETGIWLKARPDVLPHDDWIVDYKTTADIFEFKRRRAIIDYGYHQQLALVAEGLHAVGRPIPTNFVLIFQEKSSPFSCVSERLSWEVIRQGAMLNRRDLRIFAECIEKDFWPGPEQPTSDFMAPEWYLAKMQRDEEGGLLDAPGWVEKMAKENPGFYEPIF